MTSTNPLKTDIAAVFKRLKSVPSNKQCFDCGAMNPTWASVTYGVFLCIDCSAVHRSLGVHITFIRSIQLDTNWTWLQLRAMQIGGNANARSFFEQHHCTTNDSQLKYKSRAAQLYREKLHVLAMKALKQHTRLHLDSVHGESHHDDEQATNHQSGFFDEHENFYSKETSLHNVAEPIGSNSIPANGKNHSNSSLNTDRDDASIEGPNIEAALSTSPKSAEKLLASHKPTIGGRVVPAKKGLGGVKKGGLGAQKVKTNFAEIESAALERDKEVTSAIKDTKSNQDNEKDNYISMNLAYKELTIDEHKRTEQLKNLDPKKQEQVERLGMGSSGSRLVSHSATSDMQCIAQENPTNGNALFKLDRFVSRGNRGADDDFEVIDNIRSFQMKSTYYDARTGDDNDFNDKSNWNKKSSTRTANYDGDFGGGSLMAGSGGGGGGNSFVVSKEEDDRGRSRKAYPAPVQGSDGSEAQKKFGNAKAISSDQYFGGTRDIDFEAKQNLRKFEGSNAISSSELFGGAPDYSRSSGTDLSDIKEGMRQGISKVAGRLSNLASDVMGSMQRK